MLYDSFDPQLNSVQIDVFPCRVQYFSCPDKCGVFVATTKLSQPITRPSSVASSRGGRVTPALSGRTTPSPFITPGPRVPPAPESKITAGSRASKYVGLTANQLSSREAAGSQSPTRAASSMITPRATTRGPSGIGLATPKSRVSLGASVGLTPKGTGRLQYGISSVPEVPAMPSPPSLSRISNKSTPLTHMTMDELDGDGRNGADDLKSLQMNGKALQDKIAKLIHSAAPSSVPSMPPPPLPNGTSHSHARVNGDSNLQTRIDELERENTRLRMEAEATATILSPVPVEDPTPQVNQLQSRVEELEQQNIDLQSKLDSAGSDTKQSEEVSAKLDTVEGEKAKALARVSELEGQLKLSERSVKERQDKVDALERASQAVADASDKIRAEAETKLKDALAQLADSTALVGSLKEAIATASEDGSATMIAKEKEIALLEAKVARTAAELEEERRELGGQVDELRQAGQVGFPSFLSRALFSSVLPFRSKRSHCMRSA